MKIFSPFLQLYNQPLKMENDCRYKEAIDCCKAIKRAGWMHKLGWGKKNKRDFYLFFAFIYIQLQLYLWQGTVSTLWAEMQYFLNWQCPCEYSLVFLINLFRTSQDKGGDFLINVACCYSPRHVGSILFLAKQRAEWLSFPLSAGRTDRNWNWNGM